MPQNPNLDNIEIQMELRNKLSSTSSLKILDQLPSFNLTKIAKDFKLDGSISPPQVLVKNSMKNGSGKTLESVSGVPAEDAVLLQSFHYICSLPGKQIRSKLAFAFNQWLQVEPSKVEKICDIVELLHNASLLIDDIQDGSELRRGQPVAHAIFGIPQTINSANYVYFIALEKVLALGHPKAVEVFTEQLLELHRGQGMEIHWRDSFQCPSEEQYRKTIVNKTGGLFMLAIRLLQLFSNDQRDLKKLVSFLGLFFQIRDDYANLASTEYSENKSYCEDITEGKFSFPVIHAIHTHPGESQISCILKQRTKNHDLKRYFVSLLQKYGSLSYTEEALTQLEIEIRKEIESLGTNVYLTSILEELSTSKLTKNPEVLNSSSTTGVL